MSKEINTLSAASSKAALETAAAAFDEITGVLGLLYNRKKDEVPAEVTALVEKRAAAKKAKDWATADAIRAQLTELGWAVKDTAQGPQLSKLYRLSSMKGVRKRRRRFRTPFFTGECRRNRQKPRRAVCSAGLLSIGKAA